MEKLRQEVERKRQQRDAGQRALKSMLDSALQQSRQQKSRRAAAGMVQRATSAPIKRFFVPACGGGCYHLFSDCCELKQEAVQTTVTEGRRLCQCCAKVAAAKPVVMYAPAITAIPAKPVELPSLRALTRSVSTVSSLARFSTPKPQAGGDVPSRSPSDISPSDASPEEKLGPIVLKWTTRAASAPLSRSKAAVAAAAHSPSTEATSTVNSLSPAVSDGPMSAPKSTERTSRFTCKPTESTISAPGGSFGPSADELSPGSSEGAASEGAVGWRNLRRYGIARA